MGPSILMQGTLAWQTLCGTFITEFILPTRKVNQKVLKQLAAKAYQCTKENSKTNRLDCTAKGMLPET